MNLMGAWIIEVRRKVVVLNAVVYFLVFQFSMCDDLQSCSGSEDGASCHQDLGRINGEDTGEGRQPLVERRELMWSPGEREFGTFRLERSNS